MQKIRYSDCDPQGIVFNGNYARYWDDALTDWFEEKGYGGAELGGSGVDVVTARVEMDFKASAHLGDTLRTDLRIETFGNTSMTIGFTTTKCGDGDVVAVGREILVFVDTTGFRPVPVPNGIREGLAGESDSAAIG